MLSREQSQRSNRSLSLQNNSVSDKAILKSNNLVQQKLKR